MLECVLRVSERSRGLAGLYQAATRYARRASVGLRLCAFFAATRATVAGLIISLSAQITGSLAHFPTPHGDVTLLFNLHLANKKSAGRAGGASAQPTDRLPFLAAAALFAAWPIASLFCYT